MELDWTGAEPTRAGGAGMCAPRHLHCGTTHEPLPSFRARLAARRACPLHEQLDLERERESLWLARAAAHAAAPRSRCDIFPSLSLSSILCHRLVTSGRCIIAKWLLRPRSVFYLPIKGTHNISVRDRRVGEIGNRTSSRTPEAAAAMARER
jgi:hypothetical protein